MSEYFQEFNSKQDVIDQYAAPGDALDNATVYLAWYGYGSYCGDSLVIFEKDGELFEVNGSHCSCNGLEGQWSPEKTSWAALKMRNIGGEYDDLDGKAQTHFQNLVTLHIGGICSEKN